MYENNTWGEIARMLWAKSEELGRAPHFADIPCAVELVNCLRYGGWSFVLGYCGIYYRGSLEEDAKTPLFFVDFTDEQLISLVKRIAWKNGHFPRERDVYFYIECIYRWGNWENTLKACGMNMPNTYIESNPLLVPPEVFHKSKCHKIRSINYRRGDYKNE